MSFNPVTVFFSKQNSNSVCTQPLSTHTFLNNELKPRNFSLKFIDSKYEETILVVQDHTSQALM